MISKDSDIPIHLQLEEMIMGQIQKGQLKPGDKLPSEFGIANKYGICRSTVRTVIDRLVAREVVIRRAGKGSYVKIPSIDKDVSILKGFSEKMNEAGVESESRIIALEAKKSFKSDELC